MWLRGWPAATLMSAHERSPFAASTSLQTSGGIVSVFVIAMRPLRSQHAIQPFLLADDSDEPREGVQVRTAGDPYLLCELVGAFVDRALQRSDRRDDSEPQKQVLHVVCEPRR